MEAKGEILAEGNKKENKTHARHPSTNTSARDPESREELARASNCRHTLPGYSMKRHHMSLHHLVVEKEVRKKELVRHNSSAE